MDLYIHPALPQPQPDTSGMYAGRAIPGLQPDTARLYLLIAPHPAVDRLMDALAVRLALAADAASTLCEGVLCRSRSAPGVYLHILDSGNRFDLHGIARGLAGSLAGGSLQVEAVLRRILVARAFTCYQAEALLAGVVGCSGGSACAKPDRINRPRPTLTAAGAELFHLDQPGPAPAAPILAPGLLAPFADENVPLGERLSLLGRCIQHLKRLAYSAPVLVSAAPPASPETASAEAAEFLSRLETAADQVWRFEAEIAQAGAVHRGRRAASVLTGQLRMF